MKINNFDMLMVEGNSPLNRTYLAVITITTGMLWWEKTITRTIRCKYGAPWHFTDDGTYVPFEQVEAAERAWAARTNYMPEYYWE